MSFTRMRAHCPGPNDGKAPRAVMEPDCLTPLDEPLHSAQSGSLSIGMAMTLWAVQAGLHRPGGQATHCSWSPSSSRRWCDYPAVATAGDQSSAPGRAHEPGVPLPLGPDHAGEFAQEESGSGVLGPAKPPGTTSVGTVSTRELREGRRGNTSAKPCVGHSHPE